MAPPAGQGGPIGLLGALRKAAAPLRGRRRGTLDGGGQAAVRVGRRRGKCVDAWVPGRCMAMPHAHAPCPMEHGPKSTCGHQVVSSNPGRPWDQYQTVGSFRESALYSSEWLLTHLELVGFASTTESRAIYCCHTLIRVQWTLDSDLFLVKTELIQF